MLLLASRIAELDVFEFDFATKVVQLFTFGREHVDFRFDVNDAEDFGRGYFALAELLDERQRLSEAECSLKP